MTDFAVQAPVLEAAPPRTAGRVASLDGLRGVAALMVVLAHYFGETPGGLSGFTWGWIGVGLFFVLSGFLIGGIILDQKEQPKFLSGFYLKRAGRIFPAYAVALLLAYGGAALAGGQPWAEPLRSPAIYLTFTQNIAIPVTGVEGSFWLLPTWTLAVEEQFYLILPLLMLTLPRRCLVPVLGVLWAASAMFRLAIYDVSPLGALTLLPSRMDLLLAGVLAAIASRKVSLAPYLQHLRLAPLAAVIALLGVALTHDHKLFAVATPLILSLGGAAFVLSLVSGAPEARRFEGPVLGFFGLISYGLYLYHQPISGLLHGFLLNDQPNLMSIPAVMVSLVAFALSIAFAYASWRIIEAPILAATRSMATRRAP